jgi:hypothetical protein
MTLVLIAHSTFEAALPPPLSSSVIHSLTNNHKSIALNINELSLLSSSLKVKVVSAKGCVKQGDY